jgi:hypothetical protein
MKKIVVLLITTGIVCNLFAKSDDEILLGAFHKYGITKCDKFIKENSKLKPNWNLYISTNKTKIDKDINEVSVVEIFGTKGDTIKVDHSYIESPNRCFLTKRNTLTYKGSCESNIDGNSWYMSDEMATKDYATYKNKHGVEMYAKEIKMGNFKACLQETVVRTSGLIDN